MNKKQIQALKVLSFHSRSHSHQRTDTTEDEVDNGKSALIIATSSGSSALSASAVASMSFAKGSSDQTLSD